MVDTDREKREKERLLMNRSLDSQVTAEETNCHRKEMIIICQIKMAVERVVCLACVCLLGNRCLLLKFRRQVNDRFLEQRHKYDQLTSVES